jgi:transposase
MAKKSRDPKSQALQRQAALHPHPEHVTDDMFVTREFFDPRDVVQVKYEMLRRVESEGKSVTDAAAAFGFSRPSFYQAQAAFQQDGLAGLVPHKRGPKQAHKLTEAVLDFIRETRHTDPSMQAGILARRLHQRFGITVHPRSIQRALLRHQKKRH